ncbi:hypothetical protein [Actinokineospora sp. NBRC 105648]|uniref:hypothetical protein n=1 Tax=Actinokineospora sp. NBRC 105648 TaxID=3032206 RepID=UPI0024A02A83|nr:hypothetical protein [Actinokineospora sp. NBRC 105648]GLZ38930.1 hypothetical protein Acsp05_25540 [Actinokineospora sp. NBRC 105648]
MGDERSHQVDPPVHNEVSGSVGRDSLQAGTLFSGGTHFHVLRRRWRPWVWGTAALLSVALVWVLAVALSDHPAQDSGEPLVVRVREVTDPLWVWAFPDPVPEDALREGALAPTNERRGQLFRDRGAVLSSAYKVTFRGVEKSTSVYQVSLLGNRSEPVRVLDIRTRVLRRTATLDGALVAILPQNEQPVREVVTDLDDPDGTVWLTGDGGAAPRRYLDVKYLTLPRGDEVVLQLTALSARDHYEWELEVAVVQGADTRSTLRVRSDGTATGAPFTSTGWDHDVRYRGGRFSVEPTDDKPGWHMVRAG